MYLLVLVALAQTPVATDTPPAANSTSATDERAISAMERTAAAAERTAAAAEKIAQMHAAHGAAGSTAPAAAAAAGDAEAWTGTFSVGLVSLTGNAEALTLTSLLSLERKMEDWIVRAKASGAYGQARAAVATTDEAEVVALRAMGELRGDRRFTERASGFLLAGVDTDHVKSIEERFYGEAGASMIWLDDKQDDFQRLMLRTDLALRYMNEQRFQFFPVPAQVPDVTLFGPRFGVAFRYGLSKDTAFVQEAEVIPNIVGATGRVLFNSTSKLSSKLTKSLALGVSFVVTHDSQPAPGKRTTDTALTAGLDLSL